MVFTGRLPIYAELASHYEDLIGKGVYKEGDYLPSVRDVALGEGINPNTVARAFSILAEKGVVTAIPKKGYRVGKMKGDDPLVKALKGLREMGYSKEELMEAAKEVFDD